MNALRFHAFNLMPYPYIPPTAEIESTWVSLSNKYYEPQRGRQLYTKGVWALAAKPTARTTTARRTRRAVLTTTDRASGQVRVTARVVSGQHYCELNSGGIVTYGRGAGKHSATHAHEPSVEV